MVKTRGSFNNDCKTLSLTMHTVAACTMNSRLPNHTNKMKASLNSERMNDTKSLRPQSAARSGTERGPTSVRQLCGAPSFLERVRDDTHNTLPRSWHVEETRTTPLANSSWSSSASKSATSWSTEGANQRAMREAIYFSVSGSLNFKHSANNCPRCISTCWKHCCGETRLCHMHCGASHGLRIGRQATNEMRCAHHVRRNRRRQRIRSSGRRLWASLATNNDGTARQQHAPAAR